MTVMCQTFGWRLWELAGFDAEPLVKPQDFQKWLPGIFVAANQAGLLARSEVSGHVGGTNILFRGEKKRLQKLRRRVESPEVISFQTQPEEEPLRICVERINTVAV
jgi:hypothetical protein